MTESGSPLNFDTLSAEEFQDRLPELFAAAHGRISEDPRFASFFLKNPTCEALVRDLEYIADAARQLLDPAVAEPSDAVWESIQSKMKGTGSDEA